MNDPKPVLEKTFKRKTYIQDDICLMMEIRPNLYVEEGLAERLGLLR